MLRDYIFPFAWGLTTSRDTGVNFLWTLENLYSHLDFLGVCFYPLSLLGPVLSPFSSTNYLEIENVTLRKDDRKQQLLSP